MTRLVAFDLSQRHLSDSTLTHALLDGLVGVPDHERFSRLARYVAGVVTQIPFLYAPSPPLSMVDWEVGAISTEYLLGFWELLRREGRLSSGMFVARTLARHWYQMVLAQKRWERLTQKRIPGSSVPLMGRWPREMVWVFVGWTLSPLTGRPLLDSGRGGSPTGRRVVWHASLRTG